jgi:hypothetical protein
MNSQQTNQPTASQPPNQSAIGQPTSQTTNKLRNEKTRHKQTASPRSQWAYQPADNLINQPAN